MPISDKEHFDALREADLRAVDLLAKSNADRIRTGTVLASLLVSILSVLIAVLALIKHMP